MRRILEKTDAFLSGNSACLLRGEADFMDSRYWAELERRRLSSYVLPDWSAKATVESMTLWLYRIDRKPDDYEKHQATSLSEWIDLNPQWPLRAWLGEMLEIFYEDK